MKHKWTEPPAGYRNDPAYKRSETFAAWCDEMAAKGALTKAAFLRCAPAQAGGCGGMPRAWSWDEVTCRECLALARKYPQAMNRAHSEGIFPLFAGTRRPRI